MNQQGGLGVAAFHGEEPAVIVWKSVGAINADLAFGDPVGGIERQEFGGSTAIGRHLHLFGLESLAIRDQRDRARGVWSIETRNRGKSADFFRVEDAPRCVHVLHREIRDGLVCASLALPG